MSDCPFEIEIITARPARGRETVLCRKVLRTVPRRRQVLEGDWQNQSVVIKLFYSRIHGLRHLRREWSGLSEMERRNIPAPKPLLAGKTKEGARALIIQNVPNARTVSEVWIQEKNPSALRHLLENLLRFTIQMHEKGIIQRDFHAGNFLLKGDEIFALDPAQIRFSNRPVSAGLCLKQIAVLLNSLPKKQDFDLLETALIFLKENHPLWTEGTRDIFRNYYFSAQEKNLKRFLKKSLRSSKRTLSIKTGNLYGIFRKDIFEHSSAAELAKRIDVLMEGGIFLKKGNTCTVSRIQIGNQDLVVKRYNFRGWWHSFRHSLKGSRARKCWLDGHRLLYANISTALPAAFIEKRKGLFLTQSYILNRYIAGPCLNDFLHSPANTDQEKQRILLKMETLLDQLKQNKITHNDLKLTNLLIYENSPFLIDLDSLCVHPFHWLLERYYQKTKCRFQARLQENGNAGKRLNS